MACRLGGRRAPAICLARSAAPTAVLAGLADDGPPVPGDARREGEVADGEARGGGPPVAIGGCSEGEDCELGESLRLICAVRRSMSPEETELVIVGPVSKEYRRGRRR